MGKRQITKEKTMILGYKEIQKLQTVTFDSTKSDMKALAVMLGAASVYFGLCFLVGMMI